MNIYVLKQSNEKVVKEGSITEVLNEVMKIVQENSIPEVTYDNKIKATCLEFEGNYCDFKLYLS